MLLRAVGADPLEAALRNVIRFRLLRQARLSLALPEKEVVFWISTVVRGQGFGPQTGRHVAPIQHPRKVLWFWSGNGDVAPSGGKMCGGPQEPLPEPHLQSLEKTLGLLGATKREGLAEKAKRKRK